MQALQRHSTSSRCGGDKVVVCDIDNPSTKSDTSRVRSTKMRANGSDKYDWTPPDSTTAPELASLNQGAGDFKGFRRFCSKIFCGASCSRICNFWLFLFVCIGSLLAQVAPVIVSIGDTLSLVVLYLFGPSTKRSTYAFETNLLDVVLVSVVRSFCCLTAYLLLGSKMNCHKPYKYTAYVVGFGTIVFIFCKVLRYDYQEADSDDTWVAVLMFLISAVGAIAHIMCAQSIYAKAKKRRRAQLAPRYTASENDFLMEQGQASSKASGYSSLAPGTNPNGKAARQALTDSDSDDETPDLPVKAYADADSQFLTAEGVEVHYKTVDPAPSAAAATAGAEGSPGGDAAAAASPSAVVLIHGFGGGVFSWRHMMHSLAMRCGCRVLALDRPGFGLTERPYRHSFPQANNPYALHTQVKIILSLCAQLGLERVLLVGHSDGALLAVMCAAALMEDTQPAARQVKVAGLALVSPNMSSEIVPTSTRLLLQTKLGRQMLRPLLRSEIGEVAIRRAWYDQQKLTREVLETYKVPLHVEGWDRALYEVARLKGEVEAAELVHLFQVAAGAPVLVLFGAQDRVVSARKGATVAGQFPGSQTVVVPNVGHLPHEESPVAVVGLLSHFVADALVTRRGSVGGGGASTSGGGGGAGGPGPGGGGSGGPAAPAGGASGSAAAPGGEGFPAEADDKGLGEDMHPPGDEVPPTRV